MISYREKNMIEVKVIKNDLRIDATLLSYEMEQFYRECSLYGQKSCVHTAKLFYDANSCFIGEDLVPHKSIDKVVGQAILAGIDVTKSFLMVNGCLSLEMVKKVVKHQIPILASRKEITCQGLLAAIKFDLTLLCFVRDEKMKIYSHAQRINVH